MPSKEVRELIRAIEADGGIVSMTKSGHWKVVNPVNNRSLRFAASPGETHKFRLNVRTRLRRIGLLVGTAR